MRSNPCGKLIWPWQRVWRIGKEYVEEGEKRPFAHYSCMVKPLRRMIEDGYKMFREENKK